MRGGGNGYMDMYGLNRGRMLISCWSILAIYMMVNPECLFLARGNADVVLLMRYWAFGWLPFGRCRRTRGTTQLSIRTCYSLTTASPAVQQILGSASIRCYGHRKVGYIICTPKFEIVSDSSIAVMSSTSTRTRLTCEFSVIEEKRK